MSMQTYTLELREDESGEGIQADLYNEEGTIESATRASYDDHGLTTMDDDWAPDPRRLDVTADVLTVDVQYDHDGGGFEFRVVGDGETLATERVTDDDWELRKREAQDRQG